jgi:hypothetical protein
MKSAYINELLHNPSQKDTDTINFKLWTTLMGHTKDEDSEHQDEGSTYVRVHCGTKREARTLATLVALLTCRYQKNPNFFVKVMCMQQLLSSFTSNREMIQFYNLPIVKDEHNEFYQDQHKQQQHSGVIIRKKEPYMSILRSRPRQIGRVQESVHVLLGSKVEKIDQAIKQARLFNNFIRS